MSFPCFYRSNIFILIYIIDLQIFIYLHVLIYKLPTFYVLYLKKQQQQNKIIKSHKSINLWSHVTDQVIWTQGGKFEDFVMETKAVKWRNGCGLRGQTQHNRTDVCLQRNSVSSTGQVGFFWTLQRDWLTWFSCSFCTLLENWSSYSGLCLVDSHIFSSFFILVLSSSW